VNPRGLENHRIEKLGHAREIGVGVVGDDARQLGELLVLGREDDRRRAGLAELVLKLPRIEKSDLAGCRALERADLADRGLGVAGA
jgi:hypothetical protein